MEELVRLLKENKLTIGSCESLTAGLFTSMIARVSGASAVLRGGIVSYHTDVKRDVVHVDTRIIEEKGVVSEACARAMAENARKLLGADLCVSFTGNAGPSCMENEPAGSVYCALATAAHTYAFHFQINHAQRNEVRQQVVEAMRDEVIRYLKENGVRK